MDRREAHAVSTLSHLAPRFADSRTLRPGHFVRFYEHDQALLEGLTEFIVAGLQDGDRCLVIATKPHRERLYARLQTYGVNPGAANEDYLSLDAAETLSKLMIDGVPEETRFIDCVGSLVAKLTNGRQLRVFGEMVSLLCAERNWSGALFLEQFWNNLAKRYKFSLFCAYSLDSFQGEPGAHAFTDICAEHHQVGPAESYETLSNVDERLRMIAVLQQKAMSLEGEIAARKQLEAALRRREAELTDVLENCVQAIHKVGPDGTILWANKAELDLLGYTADEYIGVHIAEFHVDAKTITDILTKLRAGQNLYDYPARLRCKDGTIKDVLIHLNALFENGQFLYTRCFTRDITAFKRAEQEIHRLNDALGQKVDELHEKIKELEAFHDVVVGRELRMIEVEKENAELKAALMRMKATP